MDTTHTHALLVTRLSSVLDDKDLYRRLCACQGPDAQTLLDSFQQLLDLPGLDSNFRKQLTVATQRLSTKSGLYPACYELRNVLRISDEYIDRGGFGDIYQAACLGQVVCMKTIRVSKKSQIEHVLKKLAKETILWRQLLHPNILTIYGVFRVQNRISLVSPWMHNGNITVYLRKCPTAPRLHLIVDMANGLSYLHDNAVIHGDIKGLNVLVDDHGHALLCDFGLAAVSDPKIVAWTSQSKSASEGGTVRWQAPELFSSVADGCDVVNTTATDIYAFGCVCFEVFTGNVPFFRISNKHEHVIVWEVQKGHRPARPEVSSLSWEQWGLTDDIWSYIERCWSQDPSQRPSATEVVQYLSSKLTPVKRLAPEATEVSLARFRQQFQTTKRMLTIQDLDSILRKSETHSVPVHTDQENVPVLNGNCAQSYSSDVQDNLRDAEQTRSNLAIPEPNTADVVPDPKRQEPSTRLSEGTEPVIANTTYSPVIENYLHSGLFRPSGPTVFQRQGGIHPPTFSGNVTPRKPWVGKYDIVIAVIGRIGNEARRLFVEDAIADGNVGQGDSFTEVRYGASHHPSRKIILVYTSYFGELDLTLFSVQQWLSNFCTVKRKFSGLIYLEDTSTAPPTNFPSHDLGLLDECVDRPNVVIATIGWDDDMDSMPLERRHKELVEQWMLFLDCRLNILRLAARERKSRYVCHTPRDVVTLIIEKNDEPPPAVPNESFVFGATFSGFQRNFGEKKPSAFGGSQKPFGEEKPFAFGGSQKPFGEEKPSAFGGSQKPFGEDKPSAFGGSQKPFGEEKPFAFGGSQKPFGEEKPFAFGGSQKPFGEEKPFAFGDSQKPFGEEKPSAFGDSQKPFGEDKPSAFGGSQKPFGEENPFAFGGSQKPFGEENPFAFGGSQKPFGEEKPSAFGDSQKPFGEDKPSAFGGSQKPFGEEKPSVFGGSQRTSGEEQSSVSGGSQGTFEEDTGSTSTSVPLKRADMFKYRTDSCSALNLFGKDFIEEHGPSSKDTVRNAFNDLSLETRAEWDARRESELEARRLLKNGNASRKGRGKKKGL